MERLVNYPWPGNIRVLRNVLERAAILSPGYSWTTWEDERSTSLAGAGGDGRVRTLVDVECEHIVRVLEMCHGQVRGAGNTAEQLGVNASTLYSRMRKLGIRRAISPGPSASAGRVTGE